MILFVFVFVSYMSLKIKTKLFQVALLNERREGGHNSGTP